MSTSADDLDHFVAKQGQDPDFAAALEDARARAELVQHFADLRRERGWSQKDLAARIRTTQSAISDFEKGVAQPRLQTLQRLARAFGGRLDFCVCKQTPASLDWWRSDLASGRFEVGETDFCGDVTGTPPPPDPAGRVFMSSRDIEVDMVSEIGVRSDEGYVGRLAHDLSTSGR